MTTHTPGPWSVVEGDSVIRIEADGEPVAATDSKRYYQRFDATDTANARLIAAAPDLLVQLEFAVKLLGPLLGTTAQIDAMRAAIAKARGQANA